MITGKEERFEFLYVRIKKYICKNTVNGRDFIIS
jgi:hypothetical protein